MVSIKRLALEMIKLINDESASYFMVKIMDIFYKFPLEHQQGLLEYIAEEEDEERWLDKVDDETHYTGVLRSILFYFSGRKDLDQPSKEELKQHIGGYLKSSKYKLAEESKGAESFEESLEETV